jgi:hypothetical protein
MDLIKGAGIDPETAPAEVRKLCEQLVELADWIDFYGPYMSRETAGSIRADIEKVAADIQRVSSAALRKV